MLVSDMSSIFTTARLVGCSVLVATKNGIKARSFRDTIIIVLSMFMYFVTFVLIHVYVLLREDKIYSSGSLMIVLRVYSYYMCIFMDAASTTFWNWKIKSVISQLRDFDRATYHNSVKGKLTRIICRIIVILNFTYWITVSYMTYRTESKMAVFRSILYFIMNISLNSQILIFACILLLIGERFHHLCNMVTFSRAEGKLVTANLSTGHFTLQQIWWLHCSLVNATEMINSVYAVQLLLWISSMSVNMLSRIYSLNMNKLSDYGKIREAMQAVDCAWNLVLITTVCHMTAHQANRVGELIFSPHSTVSMKRVFLQENLEAAAYFQLRKVHFFTVAGIIRVNLPLLLSVLSALTTYLVILI